MHKALKKLEISSAQIHSFLPQNKRIKNLLKFKEKRARVMVTTDISSRGLDLQGVDFVIHYNLPSSSSDFLHRSGRAARGQRFGKTLSFITQFDQDLIKALEEKLQIEIKEYSTDSEKTILKGMANVDKIK